ncbi:MAG: hypothetical protein ABI638_04340 [Ignavibacteriota bacterium]
MSGWLEWIEDEIRCPQCNNKFVTLFVEDGDTKDPPKVITSIAGGLTRCPKCKTIIRDDDLNTSSFVTLQID